MNRIIQELKEELNIEELSEHFLGFSENSDEIRYLEQLNTLNNGIKDKLNRVRELQFDIVLYREERERVLYSIKQLHNLFQKDVYIDLAKKKAKNEDINKDTIKFLINNFFSKDVIANYKPKIEDISSYGFDYSKVMFDFSFKGIKDIILRIEIPVNCNYDKQDERTYKYCIYEHKKGSCTYSTIFSDFDYREIPEKIDEYFCKELKDEKH